MIFCLSVIGLIHLEAYVYRAAKAAPVDLGEPVSQTGQPMTFRWDASDCAGTLEDLQRYERELTELLDSEDSAWASSDVVCACGARIKSIDT